MTPSIPAQKRDNVEWLGSRFTPRISGKTGPWRKWAMRVSLSAPAKIPARKLKRHLHRNQRVRTRRAMRQHQVQERSELDPAQKTSARRLPMCALSFASVVLI